MAPKKGAPPRRSCRPLLYTDTRERRTGSARILTMNQIREKKMSEGTAKPETATQKDSAGLSSSQARISTHRAKAAVISMPRLSPCSGASVWAQKKPGRALDWVRTAFWWDRTATRRPVGLKFVPLLEFKQPAVRLLPSGHND